MTGIPDKARDHIHYAIYSAVILAVLLNHAGRPIATAGSKLTLVLMALLMLAEAGAKVIGSYRGRDASSGQ